MNPRSWGESMDRKVSGFARPVIPAPMVWRLYPTFSVYRTCRLASGIDRDSELIEVVW